LTIAPEESGAPKLSRNQRAFNQLTSKLQRLRGDLEAWTACVDHWQRRQMADLDPRLRDLLAGQRAALLWIDALLADKNERLTRRRRSKLEALVATLAQTVLEGGPDAEVEAVFNRHSGVPHDEIQRMGVEFGEILVGQMLGADVLQGHDAKTLEELLDHAGRRYEERETARASHSEAGARNTPQGRKAAAKALRAEQRASEASRSVRDVFRRLAAALHPDRESDPTQRASKTALMQRVNAAYERNDLLELLTVQIEIEQIDAAHLARASDERLAHYVSVLREQQQALELELAQVKAPLCMALNLAPNNKAPALAALDALLNVQVAELRATLKSLSVDMAALRDPATRGATIDTIEAGDEPEPFAPIRPPPRRKRRRRG